MRAGVMLFCMRTTIDLDDRLLTAAKRQAAQEGRTLRSLVEEALRARLAARPEAGEPAALPVFRPRRPGTRPGVDLSDKAGLLDVLESS